jgi:excisionase family DNA binding protein
MKDLIRQVYYYPTKTQLVAQPHLLTVAEVADLLRVEVSTIYVWTSKRKIPFRRVGGRLRFDYDEIIGWTMPKG